MDGMAAIANKSLSVIPRRHLQPHFGTALSTEMHHGVLSEKRVCFFLVPTLRVQWLPEATAGFMSIRVHSDAERLDTTPHAERGYKNKGKFFSRR